MRGYATEFIHTFIYDTILSNILQYLFEKKFK